MEKPCSLHIRCGGKNVLNGNLEFKQRNPSFLPFEPSDGAMTAFEIRIQLYLGEVMFTKFQNKPLHSSRYQFDWKSLTLQCPSILFI